MIAFTLVVVLPLLQGVALFLLALFDLLDLLVVSLMHAGAILLRRRLRLELFVSLDRGIALVLMPRFEIGALLRVPCRERVTLRRGRRWRRSDAHGLTLNLPLRMLLRNR